MMHGTIQNRTEEGKWSRTQQKIRRTPGDNKVVENVHLLSMECCSIQGIQVLCCAVLCCATGRSSSSDREPIQSNSAFSNGWQVRCKCGVTDDDGEHMVECEGGCKTWVHLKCHKIKLGHDWFCDKCQQAVHSSKAHSDDVDDPMDEPAGAGPGDAPSSDALADAAPGAKTDRATASNAADGGLTRAVEHPDTGKKGLRAAGSSPDGSRAAEDIELDLSPAVSPATKSTSKTLKKVNIFGLSSSHLQILAQLPCMTMITW